MFSITRIKKKKLNSAECNAFHHSSINHKWWLYSLSQPPGSTLRLAVEPDGAVCQRRISTAWAALVLFCMSSWRRTSAALPGFRVHIPAEPPDTETHSERHFGGKKQAIPHPIWPFQLLRIKPIYQQRLFTFNIVKAYAVFTMKMYFVQRCKVEIYIYIYFVFWIKTV